MFHWAIGPFFAAKAEPLAEPAPELVRMSEEIVNGVRIIKARSRSSRGGNWVSLIVPKTVPLKAIYMEGKPLSFGPSREEFRFFACLTPSRDGCNVEIHLGGNDPIEVLIVD